MTTPDDHALTWRDFANQLTAEQIEALTRAEDLADPPKLMMSGASVRLPTGTEASNEILAKLIKELLPPDVLASRLAERARDWAEANRYGRR